MITGDDGSGDNGACDGDEVKMKVMVVVMVMMKVMVVMMVMVGSNMNVLY